MTEEFFESKREWSRWKHRLLQRYLGKFSGIVGWKHNTVFYIDGFAGEGRYTNPPEDGSPVIAAKIAETSKDRTQLHCINIEPEHFDTLCSSTRGYATGLVENRNGTFRENLDDVLATIGTRPALFFLDPFGYKGMEWDVVTRVVERARVAITEVLLNFYVTKIDVHGGFLHSSEKPARKFVDRLDALFGTPEWQSLWDSTPSQEERILKLTGLYLDRLAKKFASVSGHGIAASYPVKTRSGKLKYFILHGTGHPSGGRAMSDVVFRVTMEYEDAKASEDRAALESDPQLMLFEPESPPSAEEIDANIVRTLIPDILARMPKRVPFNLAELEETLLSTWFGRAVEKHYRQACVQLVKEEKARRIGVETGTARKGRLAVPRDAMLELL